MYSVFNLLFSAVKFLFAAANCVLSAANFFFSPFNPLTSLFSFAISCSDASCDASSPSFFPFLYIKLKPAVIWDFTLTNECVNPSLIICTASCANAYISGSPPPLFFHSFICPSTLQSSFVSFTRQFPRLEFSRHYNKLYVYYIFTVTKVEIFYSNYT